MSWLFGSEEEPRAPHGVPERFRDGWDGDESEPVEVPIGDELDLHTYRPREARALVADYLDAARGKGFEVVRVIHGKGTGTLRKSIRSLLGKHPGVLSFEDAPPHRGGWGATMVQLRPLGHPELSEAALESPPSPADAGESTNPEDGR